MDDVPGMTNVCGDTANVQAIATWAGEQPRRAATKAVCEAPVSEF